MKRFFLACILLLSFREISACDICGCSSGAYFIGPFPQFYKHFFGIRYSFRNYKSKVDDDETQFSNDHYQTAELWGGINIGKRWQLLAFVPFNINKQTSDDGTMKSTGLGDISAILNYTVLNKKMTNKSQQLLIGAGVKLPTGKFNADPDEIIPSANNQAGTGSVDYILNTMYALRIKKWGISTAINYKINTSADNYQFGNRFNANAFVYRSLIYKKTVFNPNAGFLFEDIKPNKFEGTKVEDSGGNALLVSGGLEVNVRKLVIGVNAQLPLIQNLSSGQTEAKLRGMAHISFVF